MPPSARPCDWDIFCQVVDNYGDIGVCWRLARQLAAEHGVAVRLWVDNLATFQRICPQIELLLAYQRVAGVEVWHWARDLGDVTPGEVVIETFACRLPERFVAAMAQCQPPPVWISLDYLSAEAWISGCHALPSPHPRLPLTKYFFFPGFNEQSGGLLRERNLLERSRSYRASSQQQSDFWRTLGGPPRENALVVSLFAYENAAIARMFAAWERSGERVCCLAPLTRTLPEIEAYAGHALRVGEIVRRGNVEIRMLPFLAQDDYDRLLWSCDLNFVRGEDSFVRAQWAARPMLWHIYPQDDDVHQVKLAAFLDVYCDGLSTAAAEVLRRLHAAWNAGAEEFTAVLWTQWRAALPELRQHAINSVNRLSKQEDLCSQLVRFCRSKL